MARFHVMVKRDASTVVLEQDVQSQNVAHAAACGLSLAGGGYADVIMVQVLRPAPGRPASVTFSGCSQGVYGFCFSSRL